MAPSCVPGPHAVPGGGASLNPFVVVDDAAGFIDFLCAVFRTTEAAEARTPTPDGRLIHAEVVLGGSSLLLADRLNGWPVRPGLLQVWVDDAAAVVERAVRRSARVVTPPTPFYGETTLARLADPWDNLWWLYQHVPGQADPLPAWEGGTDVVFATIDQEMRARARQA